MLKNDKIPKIFIEKMKLDKEIETIKSNFTVSLFEYSKLKSKVDAVRIGCQKFIEKQKGG